MADNCYQYEGKIAVISGASRGIGQAVLRELANRGCHVVAIARPSNTLDDTVNSLIQHNLKVTSCPCDLNDTQAITTICEYLKSEFKRIDILVNCAGVGKLGPFLNMTAQEIQAPIKVPLQAAISLSHELLPAMINHGEGRIINIITPAAYFDLPFMASYSASRSGLLSFTRALDEEYKHQGVRVRAVCPAWVDTGYLVNNHSDGGWYPKVAGYFPTVTAEQAANYVISNRR